MANHFPAPNHSLTHPYTTTTKYQQNQQQQEKYQQQEYARTTPGGKLLQKQFLFISSGAGSTI
jgi:hypothetical protein